MSKVPDRQKQLAVKIAKAASAPESEALKIWAVRLLDIRDSQLPAHKKAQRAIAVTLESKVIWRILKIVARQTKDVGWDNRTIAQRVGLGGAAAGLALFGTKAAGIAALGGAIGVPLWVVLGAGSMFARYLYEELTEKAKEIDDSVTYTVIDAKQVDAERPYSSDRGSHPRGD